MLGITEYLTIRNAILVILVIGLIMMISNGVRLPRRGKEKFANEDIDIEALANKLITATKRLNKAVETLEEHNQEKTKDHHPEDENEDEDLEDEDEDEDYEDEDEDYEDEGEDIEEMTSKNRKKKVERFQNEMRRKPEHEERAEVIKHSAIKRKRNRYGREAFRAPPKPVDRRNNYMLL